MQAIQITQHGGPEVLRLAELPAPRPAATEVLVANRFVGVNFVDTYYRTGVYPGVLPLVPGLEGVGTVLETGAEVRDLRPGDRVAYAMAPGAYAGQTAVPRGKVWRLPEDAGYEEIATHFLQGMTAVFLADMADAFHEKGAVAVHGAGSGVGVLLVQMLRGRGRRVFATTRSRAKAARLRAAGADEVFIACPAAELAGELRRRQVRLDVLYDSVGGGGCWDGLAGVRSRGLHVLFGQSAGPAPALDPQALRQHGSLYVTRPSLTHYLENENATDRLGNRLFAMLRSGVRGELDRTFPLAAASEAHRWLATRPGFGKVLLQPPPTP